MRDKPSKFKVALTVGRLAGRRLLGRKEGEHDEALGQLLAEQLDEMKGLAMKLGQIVSYMDVPLPESVQQKLATLQTGVTCLSEVELRGVLSNALGEDFESRFDWINFKPIAAASIGQVHQASVNGDKVALKVQYPQIAQTFRADLGPVSRIASFAGIASQVDGAAIVAELGARLEEECDYLREAAYQQAFCERFDGVAGIHVPSIHAPLCTPSTVVSQWVSGLNFVDACQQPQEVRNRYAEMLVRFSYQSLFELAVIQADPHPGNFIFHEDGEVTFLDFGCVRAFTPVFVEALRTVARSVEHNDMPRFRAAICELGLAPRPEKFNFEHMFESMKHLHRPLFSEKFEFTSKFVRDGLAFNGPASPNARQINIPGPYLWVARLQWGLWSLLSRLRADVSLRSIYTDILARPIAALERRTRLEES